MPIWEVTEELKAINEALINGNLREATVLSALALSRAQDQLSAYETWLDQQCESQCNGACQETGCMQVPW